jgi:signal transduction histidine kinase
MNENNSTELTQERPNFWQRLTEADPSITSVLARRRIQLLASVLIIFIVFTALGLIASTVGGYHSPIYFYEILGGLFVSSIVLFPLSKSGYYKWVSIIILAIMLAFPIVALMARGDYSAERLGYTLPWIIVSFQLGGALLSFRKTEIFIISGFLIILGIPLILHEGNIKDFIAPLGLVGTVSCLILANIRYRELLETDRQTVLLQHNRELKELHASLEQRVAERTAQLEAANKELEAFSYSVSHDLRSPLRAIDGYSKIILKDFGGELDADVIQNLEKVRSSVKRMAVLIDDLLAFSHLGRQAIKVGYVSSSQLQGMLQEIICDLQEEAQGRTVEVEVGKLPACKADATLLRQIFANLLSNAFKFTRPCPRAHIQIGAITTQNGPTIFVRDNGVGFDMKQSDKLFGVFQRLHSQDDFEGTGVGLAMVQRIVQHHGGRIWAESEPGKGATFYFTLNASRD